MARRVDGSDAITREEEGTQAWGEGEVGDLGNVVVGQVESIVVLHSSSTRALLRAQRNGRDSPSHFCDAQVFNGGYLVAAQVELALSKRVKVREG